jgi:hypothetical protein
MPTLKIIFGLFEIREECPAVLFIHCHRAGLASGVEPLTPVSGLEKAQRLDLGAAWTSVYRFVVHMFKRGRLRRRSK